MTQIATARLIDASAALSPADRALLNLWVNRGLDDEALARLSHVDVDAIAVRRANIVEHLSQELGLPPADIRSALDELAASAREALAPQRHAGATNGVAPAGIVGVEPAPAASESEEEPTHPPTASESPQEPAHPPSGGRVAPARRFRRSTWIGLLIAAVVVVVVVIVALASADGTRHRAVTVRSTPARTGTAAPVPQRPSHRQTLTALPGGPQGAGGSVAVVGPPSHPRLALSVTGLLRVQGGHYEAWLYNSILDSVPVTRLRAPKTRITVVLPGDYRRYRWIDISFQPPGMLNDSGESVLRAPTPR